MSRELEYLEEVDRFREWADRRGVAFRDAMVAAMTRLMREVEQYEERNADVVNRLADITASTVVKPDSNRRHRSHLGKRPGNQRPEMTAKCQAAKLLIDAGQLPHAVWRVAGFRSMQAMKFAMTSRGMWGSSP